MKPQYCFADLENASVFITGGGSGIGAALTEGFVRQGAKVAFIDIAEAPSRSLVERLGRENTGEPLFLKGDLRDIDALREAIASAEKLNGPISILINNAGWDDRHSIEAVNVEYWDNNLAINLRPHFFAAQAVASGMKKAGRGAIVNFTSTSFMLNQGDFPAYTAAKAGVIGLTKSLAGALGPYGVRVNAIAPGWVMTQRQRDLWADPQSLAAHLNRQCLKTEIMPEDMVGPCLFLASDASRVLTAQTILVDGGTL